jgi:hypothetical protein
MTHQRYTVPSWGLGSVHPHEALRAEAPVYVLVPEARSSWGLGATQQATFGDSSALVPTAGQATGAVNIGIQTANSTGSAAAGAVASGLSLASAIDPEPISKAILAIGAALTGIVTKMIQGCGATCTDASNYVNQIEPQLVQNVATYTSSPVRTQTMQANALANFDSTWAALLQTCQGIGGRGGTNCVTDRQQGACTWKASPGGWSQTSGGGYTYTPAGAAGSGNTCWNWFVGYRDPIANDPDVVPDSAVASASSAVSSLTSGSTAGIPNEFLLLGALALLAVML